MYKNIVCVGVFLDPDDVRPVTNGKLDEYREKVVTFKDGLLVAAQVASRSKGACLSREFALSIILL